MAKPIGHGGKDTADWGVSALSTSTALVTDMSELAVRLGSIHTFDRTGTVLFFDDFSCGLVNWEHSSYPAAAFAVATARYHSIKPYSIKLQTTTDSGSYSGLQRGFPVPYTSRMGLEFHLKVTSSTHQLYIPIYCYTGERKYFVQLDIVKPDNALYLWPGTGAKVKICDYTLQSGSVSPFHIIKIVWDLEAGYYHRLVIDEKDYDVSDITLKSIGSGIDPYFYLYFLLFAINTTAQRAYLDNIVITIDEPK